MTAAEIALAMAVIGALLTLIGSWLRRRQNRRMAGRSNEQNPRRDDPASRNKPD
jgi:hypothetical protein